MDEAIVRVARALGDPTRFALLRAIAAAGEVSCGELAARFPVAQPTVSHHVRVLADCGLVAVRKVGQHSYFRAVHEAVARYRDELDRSLRPGDRESTSEI